MPRSPGVNLALEYTGGWRSLIYRETIDKFGGNIQGIFFFEETHSNNQLGAYFSPAGARCKPTLSCDPCQPQGNGQSFTFGFRRGDDQTITPNLNLRSFIQLPFAVGPSADEHAASMSLSMKRSVTGFAITIHQDLDNIWNGLFFKLNVPLRRVEHTVNCSIKGADVTAGEPSTTISCAQVSKALAHYYAGDEVNVTFTDGTSTGVLQQVLKYQLIPCAANSRCSEDETGIRDIDFQLGYHIINTVNSHVYAALGVTMPTGNEVKNSRLWAPLVGNGGHTGVGFNLYGDAKVWGDKNHNLFFMSALNYRYLLLSRECRTLGLCGQPWGHYRLLGQKDQNLLIPAANILTQKVDVTPGSQIDFIIQGNYNYYGFAFDLGYNAYFKQEESILFAKCGEVLPTGTYALASTNYDNRNSNVLFGTNPSDFEGGTPHYLSQKDVDKSVAKTPSQLSHKVYGGISYGYKKWDIPIMFGMGAHYEVSGMNKTPGTWGFNVKGAVAF